MAQLAQLAQTLNNIADEKTTSPDDVFGTMTERGDAFERIIEELDAHKKRIMADEKGCADVVAAAQRLKAATDARAAAFRASLSAFVEVRCRAVEAEYDALIAAKAGEAEALQREKAGKVADLLSLLIFEECGTFDRNELLLTIRNTPQLKEWTGKERATVVYDSKADPFTANGLFEKVKGKPNIAIVATTTDGDVFGGFYSVAVTGQEEAHFDPNQFAFSFESHGRCMTPQRFVVKEELRTKARVVFFENRNGWFVGFWVDGCGGFYLGEESSNTFCIHLSRGFEGLQDTTLTGQNGTCHEGPFHHCARLVAIQLE